MAFQPPVGSLQAVPREPPTPHQSFEDSTRNWASVTTSDVSTSDVMTSDVSTSDVMTSDVSTSDVMTSDVTLKGLDAGQALQDFF